MPKRTSVQTREDLKQVPLPQHASSYTVITHETVIVNALDQLKRAGFTIESERYRANNSGEVALGIYYLKYKNDPELGMMFAWANSYDKSMRFKCTVGGFVRISNSSIISGDFSWGRKHTGTADSEMIAQVNTQIMNGQMYYEELLLVKDKMKNTQVSVEAISEFLGRAFFKQKLFTKEQIGIVRDEMIKPSFDYNADPHSLWTYYNHMLVALKKAHPRTWMEEQRNLHKFVCSEFEIKVHTSNIAITPTTPNPDADQSLSLDQEVEPVKMEDLITPAEEKLLDKMEEDLMVKGEAKINIKTDPKEPNEGPDVLTQDPMEILEDEDTESTEESVMEDTNKGILGDISEEEQKLIDERMATMFGDDKDSDDLNLPD